jgi:membrane associated rhomboid family serine protease
MSNTGIIGLILIVANFIFSYKGFNSQAFLDRYKFEVDSILVRKDYKRLITSGFLHVSWIHLILNMVSLYLFSGFVESYLGGGRFLIIYFASLIGGDLLSLFIHRNHGDYSAVGASGAVCGIIFASIAISPGMSVSMFGLPISLPAWLYGLAYILYSIYGIRSGKDNIGHDAHLGGALIGMAVALLMQPDALADNYITILLIAVPAIAFICFIILKPHYLMVDNFFFKNQKDHYSPDHKYNEERYDRQKEVDRILEKIHRSGIKSLTQKEKDTLNEHSKRIS